MPSLLVPNGVIRLAGRQGTTPQSVGRNRWGGIKRTSTEVFGPTLALPRRYAKAVFPKSLTGASGTPNGRPVGKERHRGVWVGVDIVEVWALTCHHWSDGPKFSSLGVITVKLVVSSMIRDQRGFGRLILPLGRMFANSRFFKKPPFFWTLTKPQPTGWRGTTPRSVGRSDPWEGPGAWGQSVTATLRGVAPGHHTRRRGSVLGSEGGAAGPEPLSLPIAPAAKTKVLRYLPHRGRRTFCATKIRHLVIESRLYRYRRYMQIQASIQII